jgi:hypothetical protein
MYWTKRDTARYVSIVWSADLQTSSPPTEKTLLSNRIQDYVYISQGKTRIPGVNDSEDMALIDVSGFRNTSSITSTNSLGR